MTQNLLRSATADETSGGVRRLELSFGVAYEIRARVLPYLNGSIYLFAELKDPTTWTIVDSGCGNAESDADLEAGFQIVRADFDRRFSPDRIKRILLTHAHIDHFGGACALKKRTGAEIWIHSFEARLVEAYDDCARVENRRYYDFLRECGVPESDVQSILDGFGFRPGRAKGASVDRRLYGGEEFGALKTHYLPGHSSGHIAYQFGDVVFSGDLLLSKTLTQIWPARMTPQTGSLNYLASLYKFRNLALSYEKSSGRRLTAFPAHEETIDDVPGGVDRALKAMAKRDRRLLKTLATAGEPLTLAELAPRMYWSGRPHREFFALSDVAARAEFLLALGKLKLVRTEEVSVSRPALRFEPSLTDTEPTENIVEQLVGMDFSGDRSDSVERES